jgi:hypothetical protein
MGEKFTCMEDIRNAQTNLRGKPDVKKGLPMNLKCIKEDNIKIEF